MYESHFGLSGPPFQLVPDPSFYFSSKGHSNALAFLKFGAHQGEGFIVVTGEIGAGKTTLVRTLLDGLDPASVVAAPVISSQLEPGELQLAILLAFGVETGGEQKAQLLGRLEAFLTDLSAKGRRALLIVDEAQNLPTEVIEELRLLTNFQLGKNAMLQVFLIGQPELRAQLQSKAMEQMRQRVTASCHLGPLDPAETRAYVEHRLRLVGWADKPRFELDAFQQLHRWTGGIPRRINRLCNRLLLSAFLETKDAIVAEDVEQIAQEVTPSPAGVVAAHEASKADPTRPNPAAELKPDATEVERPAARVQVAAAPIPVLRPVPDTELAGAAAAPAPTALPGRPEISARRNATPAEPLICLVDSAADYVKARALARICGGRAKLPAMMTVHTGSVADADVGEGLSGVMPASANDVHLGIDERGGAASVAAALLGFDAVLREHSPSAVLAMGSGDTLLACSLLAHKSGVPVLRNDAGRRRAWAWAGEEMNAVLLERFADISYINDLATYYTLYRVGIATDRVICVGDLADNVVHFAADHTVQPDEVLRRADISTAHLKSQHGYAVATTQIEPRDDLRRYVENLSARLIEVGKLLPVFWSINAFTLREVQAAGLQARLAAASVVLIPSLGYLDCLDLMRRARCLIAGSTGDYLDEAVSLGVQTLVLGKDIVVPVKGGESVQQNVAQGVDKLGKLVAEVLAATPNRRPPAAKWDGGPAARIADHLEAWLPKQKKAKARQVPIPRVRPLEPSAKLA